MLLNSKRETVSSCTNYGDSNCPLCDDKLSAKVCKDRVSHWAHYPCAHDKNPDGQIEKPKCMHFESEWHLRMKLAYMTFNGWDIEVPIKMNGVKYLVDAVNLKTKVAREFVHTLNPQLIEKHKTLKEKRPDNVMWIYDGEMFASAYRRRKFSDKGTYFQKMLKPTARRLYAVTGGLIHFDGKMYKKGSFGDCWFEQTGRATREILKRYEAIDFTNVENNPEVIRDLVSDEAIKQFVKKL